ncbi:DNA-binding response regulator [Methylopila jiangsuensis]|uniref:DNA-binding response regulator n=1 Tax=Methylopila jiangsuensis TaxID=586230 RepID=A0A9W6JFQ4_9HYPH|nr:response regulator transcription factor [Methylopila jiangsuensis]MDR6286896.1 DNA-binding response OmpR family regulator [Methylopila jiangsuensis]GLK76755.1 DNA-binding response regulator [Methylopila jiangsuensis]
MTSVVVIEIGGLRGYLATALDAEGFAARTFETLPETGAAEIVLIAAPAADARVFAELAALRVRAPDAIAVVATDADVLAERLACYEAGADACFHRPFHLSELAAKLRALLRRRGGGAMALITGGDAVLDHRGLELKVGDRRQDLTRRETELLALLARANGALVDRESVLREAWGAPSSMTHNSVDVYVGYVRRKLAKLGSDVTVRTVRGAGFHLVRRPAPAPARSAAAIRK